MQGGVRRWGCIMPVMRCHSGSRKGSCGDHIIVQITRRIPVILGHMSWNSIGEKCFVVYHLISNHIG
jgi:hypothetical protein